MSQAPQPGWYADPYVAGGLRYWSGVEWTGDAVVPAAQRPARVSFTQAIRICFTKYVTWQGRAGLAEYWWWYLFYTVCWLPAYLIVIASFVAAYRTDTGVATWFYVVAGLFLVGVLVLLLPSISVGIRRLHDTDRSGAWYWLALVPLGSIVLLVFFLMSGTPGPNRYGPVPGHQS